MKRKLIALAVAFAFVFTSIPASFAAGTNDLYGSSWTGKYGSTSKTFRAYAAYNYEPNYSDTQARLYISDYGVQCLSKSSSLVFVAKSEKKASVSVSLAPVSGSKTHQTDKTSPKISFPNAKKNAKAKFYSGGFYWYFNKTDKAQTLKLTVKANKGKQPGSSPKAWYGSSSGSVNLTVPAKVDSEALRKAEIEAELGYEIEIVED